MKYDLEPKQTITFIKKFLVDQLEQSGLDGYVVGLSGGIDSALSASLATAAVGSDRVYGLIMPYRTSVDSSKADALNLATSLEIDHRIVDISPMIDAYYERIQPDMRIRAGNKMARERMAILFDLAHQMNRLVLGTGNRTEFCLGYTTLFGDAACSVNPIGELYKSEVRLLARELGVPEAILTKPPSADLWVDQTDEGEIGVTYDEIDAILRLIIDSQVTSRSALEKAGIKRINVDRVVSLINRNSFKRFLPPVAGLGRAAVPDKINLT
jgi:NAD+ synthase